MTGVLNWRHFCAGLRGARALFLASVLLLNAILPSMALAAQNATMQHDLAMDHAAMDHAVSASAQGAMQEHENHGASLHCMSLVCCYQEASVPFALVASDAYVTNGQRMDHGSHLPSILGSSKDRPPQQI